MTMPIYKKELILEPFIIGAIAIMLLVPGVVLTTQKNALGYVLIVVSIPCLLISLADAVGFVYLRLRAPPAYSDFGSLGNQVTRMMNA